MKITLDTTLADVFENHYRPELMKWPSANTLIKWRQALCRFDAVLGRPATVADLTADVVAQAADLMGSLVSGEQKRKFRKHILTLWGFLGSKKIIPSPKGHRIRRHGMTFLQFRLKPGPAVDHSDWGRKTTTGKPKGKQRLITIPQTAVEALKPTDPLEMLIEAYVFRRLSVQTP